MKRTLAFILCAFLVMSLTACVGNSVDLSDGQIDIGSICFSLSNVSKGEKIGDLSYLLTLIEDETWLSVTAVDASSYDESTAEALVEVQQENCMAVFPDRFGEEEATHSFAGVSFPCAAYEVINDDGAEQYHLTGSFLYNGYAYTLDFYSTNSDASVMDAFSILLTNSEFLTTGTVWTSEDTAEAEPTETGLAIEYGGPLVTEDQQAALDAAMNYLAFTPFSYDGLLMQLRFEGYSTWDATYAVNHCGANWKEQALNKAKDYLESSAFSYSGLIKQLEFEKFTSEEAQYGASHCGADWNEQAVKAAWSYRRLLSLSGNDLIDQLVFEGFTYSQAAYAEETTR